MSRFGTKTTFGSLVIAARLAAALWNRHRTEKKPPAPKAPAVMAPGSSPQTKMRSPQDNAYQPLQSVANALKDAPGDSRRLLAELQRSLSAQPPQLASAMIREILDSGADAPTQLDFKVGPNGLLSEAPSLRVFLLDYLAQLDRLA